MGAEAPKLLPNCVRCVLKHDLVALCCIAAPPSQIALDVQALCVQLAIQQAGHCADVCHRIAVVGGLDLFVAVLGSQRVSDLADQGTESKGILIGHVLTGGLSPACLVS